MMDRDKFVRYQDRKSKTEVRNTPSEEKRLLPFI